MFNPFEKPIKDIQYSDLDKLIANNFSESLFIEYKSNSPKPKKIAKAISGFANSHGGYLLIGANKDCNNDELPNGFPGATNLPQQPKEHVRQVCKHHISGMPLYECKYLENPTTKNGILVIHVPESMDTPHINRDGKIYRRQSSGTDGESIAETDRKTVDNLFEKGRNARDRFADYIETKQGSVQFDKITDKFVCIETILCPIPVRNIIPNLFDEDYYKCIGRQQVNYDVDINSIYFSNPDEGYHCEIDLNGCVYTQYNEKTIFGGEIGNIHPLYKDRHIILPSSIESAIKEPLNVMRDVLKFLRKTGYDYYGNIRMAMTLTNVLNRSLYYENEHLFYQNYGVKYSRHRKLIIPHVELFSENLLDNESSNNIDILVKDVMKHIQRGFGLHF